MRCRLAHAS